MVAQDSIASVGKRVVAMGIDSIILSIFVFILYKEPLMAISSELSTATTTQLQQDVFNKMIAFNRQTTPYVFALFLLYHSILVWLSGATVGKYIMGLRVVDQDQGQNLNLLKSTLRALFRTAGELFLLYLTFLPAFFNPLKQTLHDKLAGSAVIDIRKSV